MRIEKSLYDEAEELTKTNYKGIYKEDDKQVLVYSEEIEGMIENLIDMINHLKKELKDLEEDRDENYKPIPYKDQVGVSDKDFY